LNRFLKSLIAGTAVVWMIIGTVPNIELLGSQFHGIGQSAKAESVPIYTGGMCNGLAMAHIASGVASALLGVGWGGTLLYWAKKVGKATPLGVALTGLGIFLAAIGTGFGLISMYMNGKCTSLYISEVIL